MWVEDNVGSFSFMDILLDWSIWCQVSSSDLLCCQMFLISLIILFNFELLVTVSCSGKKRKGWKLPVTISDWPKSAPVKPGSQEAIYCHVHVFQNKCFVSIIHAFVLTQQSRFWLNTGSSHVVPLNRWYTRQKQTHLPFKKVPWLNGLYRELDAPTMSADQYIDLVVEFKAISFIWFVVAAVVSL